MMRGLASRLYEKHSQIIVPNQSAYHPVGRCKQPANLCYYWHNLPPEVTNTEVPRQSTTRCTGWRRITSTPAGASGPTDEGARAMRALLYAR